MTAKPPTAPAKTKTDAPFLKGGWRAYLADLSDPRYSDFRIGAMRTRASRRQGGVVQKRTSVGQALLMFQGTCTAVVAPPLLTQPLSPPQSPASTTWSASSSWLSS